MMLLFARALALACRGHHELVLENIALQQQLSALKRSGVRPRLRQRDRLFWVVLATIWIRWRSALILVQPDTVVRWHRDWFRRRWTRRSRHPRAGRPPTIEAKTRVRGPVRGAFHLEALALRHQLLVLSSLGRRGFAWRGARPPS